MTLDDIKERDATWDPRCQSLMDVHQCVHTEFPPVGLPNIHQPWRQYPAIHPFTYDPALDTSPEADRRALLATATALTAALAQMMALAMSSAIRAHLDGAGIAQHPPHGMGRYADCRAPWCVRNQVAIATARALLPEATP